MKKPLEQSGIDIFIDNTIITGEYNPVIKHALDKATAAVLLLSPDFMNSDYIIEKELPALITRYKANQLEFFPILLSHCIWDILKITYSDPNNKNNKAYFLLSNLLLAGHDPEPST